MVALMVVSPEKAAGKTAIAAGLARSFSAAGKKPGYLRAIAANEESGAKNDAAFLKNILDLNEEVDSLCLPVGNGFKDAYSRVSAGKDVVVVEGGTGETSQASFIMAEALGAKVIALESYSPQPSRFIGVYEGYGKNLLGVIINKVPKKQLKTVREKAAAQFQAAGIKLLGVIPEDRTLLSLNIGQIAESVQGKILNSPEKSADLAENYMIGAMCVDSGLEYYGRKTQKAAIIRSDRPDMQLAALETPTACMIIGGASPLLYNVRFKAENKGIPIILTEKNTNEIVAGIESALAGASFNQEKKLARLAEVLQDNVDLKAVSGIIAG